MLPSLDEIAVVSQKIMSFAAKFVDIFPCFWQFWRIFHVAPRAGNKLIVAQSLGQARPLWRYADVRSSATQSYDQQWNAVSVKNRMMSTCSILSMSKQWWHLWNCADSVNVACAHTGLCLLGPSCPHKATLAIFGDLLQNITLWTLASACSVL